MLQDIIDVTKLVLAQIVMDGQLYLILKGPIKQARSTYKSTSWKIINEEKMEILSSFYCFLPKTRPSGKIPSRHQVLTELRRKLSPDFSYQSIRTQFYNQLPPYTANCQAAVTYIEMDQDTNVEQTVLHPTKR